MMTSAVGIRELKNHLSKYLGKVKTGQRILVTERGRAIAVLSPPAVTPADEGIEGMIREGLLRWGGGRPRGNPRPPRIKGPSVARAVIEGRR